MWARINRKLRLPRQFRDLSRATNLRHVTHGFTSLQKEGVLRIFFALKKSWRLRPGLNPRTWVLKASTLPLYHRSRQVNLQSECYVSHLWIFIVVRSNSIRGQREEGCLQNSCVLNTFWDDQTRFPNTWVKLWPCGAVLSCVKEMWDCVVFAGLMAGPPFCCCSCHYTRPKRQDL